MVAPSCEIVIVTANYSLGIAVLVKGLGLGLPAESLPLGLLGQAEASNNYAPLETVSPERTLIDIPIGGEFTIKVTAPNDGTGSLDIDFNPCLVSLKNAKIGGTASGHSNP